MSATCLPASLSKPPVRGMSPCRDRPAPNTRTAAVAARRPAPAQTRHPPHPAYTLAANPRDEPVFIAAPTPRPSGPIGGGVAERVWLVAVDPRRARSRARRYAILRMPSAFATALCVGPCSFEPRDRPSGDPSPCGPAVTQRGLSLAARSPRDDSRYGRTTCRPRQRGRSGAGVGAGRIAPPRLYVEAMNVGCAI